MRFRSKFEDHFETIKSEFRGPYPLDKTILEGILSEKPGIYIWYDSKNGRKLGYVGQAISLIQRLQTWACELESAEVFFQYAPKSSLNSVERYWIEKAGDLNKR